MIPRALTPPYVGKRGEAKKHRSTSLKHATSIAKPGVWVEAGVASGRTARYILRRLKRDTTLHLFDSFEGLPRAWWKFETGAFKPARAPSFRSSRVAVHVGLFHETMPAWARTQTSPVTFLHVDCDLYESAITVLRSLDGLLRPGAVIAFDEAIGYDACVSNEGRALREWSLDRGVREVAWTGYTQLIVEVTR